MYVSLFRMFVILLLLLKYVYLVSSNTCFTIRVVGSEKSRFWELDAAAPCAASCCLMGTGPECRSAARPGVAHAQHDATST